MFAVCWLQVADRCVCLLAGVVRGLFVVVCRWLLLVADVDVMRCRALFAIRCLVLLVV